MAENATIEYVLATEYNYPNIEIYRRMVDGVQNGWKIATVEDYVMYDTTANDMEHDPETDEYVPVTYYLTVAHKPQNYNWNNFHYVAVPRDSVDENYIFGVGDNNHEIM